MPSFMGIQSPAFPVHPGIRQGSTVYYPALSSAVSTTASAVTANLLYSQLFVAPFQRINRVGLEVTVGVAGNVRLGIYTNFGTAPNSLIVDGGAFSTASPAVIEATIDVVLPNDYVWLVAVFDATPTIRVGSPANSGLFGTTSMSVGTRGFQQTFTYGVLPAVAPNTGFAQSPQCPHLSVRYA